MEHGRQGAPKEFESRVLHISRVARVVAGGKRFTFRVVVAIGNRMGRVGVGVDKGPDVTTATEKAVADAQKHMIQVPLRNGTIPHEVRVKYGPSRVILRPTRKGRGLIAGGAVRVVCDLAGIKDISAKILSPSSNRLNNARATSRAFQMLAKRISRKQEPRKAEEKLDTA